MNHSRRRVQRRSVVRRALVVGINYIGSPNELAGCVNDAKNIRQALIQHYGFAEPDITLMTDETGTAPKLRPTAKNLFAAIDALTKDIRSGDSLVFFYSGHGSWVEDDNGDETSGKDETLVPLDFEASGLLIDDVLKKRLVDVLPAGVHLTCVVDSCHSGSIMDLAYTMIPKGEHTFSLALNPKESVTSAEVVCISGCRDSQTSADTVVDKLPAGALTGALLHVLQQQSWSVDYCSLLQHIRQWLKQGKYQQVPQLCFGRLLTAEKKFSFV
jgi:hypothetical protein